MGRNGMIHYHGTPITPRSTLQLLAGNSFCVPFSDPRDVETCHRIGESVMLDNGAFTMWRRGVVVDWAKYYAWALPWLDYHTTWLVIPDVIDGSESENDELMIEWVRNCHGKFKQGAPVWHLHESIGRLQKLTAWAERVCFGSSGAYAQIGTSRWHDRVSEAFDAICYGSGRPKAWIHMLRGMSLAGSGYPFSSVDSTDIAQNHHIGRNDPVKMARRWNAQQCSARWNVERFKQMELRSSVREVAGFFGYALVCNFVYDQGRPRSKAYKAMQRKLEGK